MNMLARIVIATCLIGLSAVHASAGEDKKPDHSAVKPVPRQGAPVKRHEMILERAKRGDIDLLFLGDSITQGWDGQNGRAAWKEHFESLKAANFGIGGDRTQHVLWRITEGKELEGIRPKLVVLLIGTNNLGNAGPTSKEGKVGTSGNTAEAIADGVSAIVAELRTKLPGARVLLLGIFPRAEKPDTEMRAKIRSVNDRIAKLADRKHVHYLDLGPAFLDKDGVLTIEIMPDYLHLSREGYARWAAAIKPRVEELLKQ